MRKIIFEWIWRLAMLAALVWIGRELHALREDVNQPAPQDVSTADDLQDSLDLIRDEIDGLGKKVDALLVVAARQGH